MLHFGDTAVDMKAAIVANMFSCKSVMGFSFGRGITKKRGTDFNQETIGYPEH